MHFLLVAALLITSDSTDAHQTAPLRYHHIPLNPLLTTQSVEAEPRYAHLVELIPYEQELNELYQRYHADKRWENGVGITFALGYQKQRLTIGLGPIQFGFGGQRPPGR